MSTTVQVSDPVKSRLESMKQYPRQTYNELIEQLIDVFEAISENKELSKEVLEEIAEARKEIKTGKGVTTKQLLKNLGVSA